MKEIIIILIQLFMFYIFPLFAGPTDGIGMVLLIILTTFILAMIMGAISNKKLKYLYPIGVSIIFIPSIFIYYNSSALVHTIWYFVVTLVGLFVGIVILKLTKTK